MKLWVLIVGLIIGAIGAILSGYIPAIPISIELGSIYDIPISTIILAVGALISLLGIVLPEM